MEQTPSIQKLPCLLYNLKTHYLVCKSLLKAPILIQINAIHNLQPYSPHIHFNIIFLSMLSGLQKPYLVNSTRVSKTVQKH